MKRQRLNHTGFVIGLVLLGAMIAGGREARAGGVSAKLGSGQGGDPIDTYIATVTLNANTSVPGYTGGSSPSLVVTFTGITGITSNATDTVDILSQNPSYPQSVWTVSLSASNGGTITLSEVNYSAIGPYTSATQLVDVQIVTPMNAPPALPPGTMVSYTTSINGSSPAPATATVYAIPEPSSVIMMLMGAAILPYCAIRARRRALLAA